MSPNDFVAVWQTSNSLDEVARRVGANKNAVRARAHRYRSRGVPLKSIPRRPLESIDWRRLAELAQNLVGNRREQLTGS